MLNYKRKNRIIIALVLTLLYIGLLTACSIQVNSKKESIRYIPTENKGEIHFTIEKNYNENEGFVYELEFNLKNSLNDEEITAIKYINGRPVDNIILSHDELVGKLSTISVGYYKDNKKVPCASKVLNDFLVYSKNVKIEDVKTAKYLFSEVTDVEKRNNSMSLERENFIEYEFDDMRILKNFEQLEFLYVIGLATGDISVLKSCKKIKEIYIFA